MKFSTTYFIGSFLMAILCICNVIWNHGNSSVIFSFFAGVAFGWGVVSGILMRMQGD